MQYPLTMVPNEREMARVTVTVPVSLLEAADAALGESGLENRSRFVQAALRAYLRELRGARLAAQAALLDAAEEEDLAEEGLAFGDGLAAVGEEDER